MQSIEDRFLGYFRLLESLCSYKKDYLDSAKLDKITKNTRVKKIFNKYFEDPKNVKSFLGGIKRYNNSKYNTEKNIQDWLSKIPKGTSIKWAYSKEDIGAICKLRNDITHANSYSFDEAEIEKKSKFIEVLLVLKLFEKIEISLDTSCKIIDRLSKYSLIYK